MYEEMSWKMFEKTGDINQYLLYKEMLKSDSSDNYGVYKNNGGSPKASDN